MPFSRSQQRLAEEAEVDIEALVRQELQEALNSSQVQKALRVALNLQEQCRAVVVEEKHHLVQQVIADLNLGARLSALVADPRTAKQLVAHIDVGAVLKMVDLDDRLRGTLAATDMLALLRASWPPLKHAAKRALHEDDATLANAQLGCNAWVFAGMALALCARSRPTKPFAASWPAPATHPSAAL